SSRRALRPAAEDALQARGGIGRGLGPGRPERRAGKSAEEAGGDEQDLKNSKRISRHFEPPENQKLRNPFQQKRGNFGLGAAPKLLEGREDLRRGPAGPSLHVRENMAGDPLRKDGSRGDHELLFQSQPPG